MMAVDRTVRIYIFNEGALDETFRIHVHSYNILLYVYTSDGRDDLMRKLHLVAVVIIINAYK